MPLVIFLSVSVLRPLSTVSLRVTVYSVQSRRPDTGLRITKPRIGFPGALPVVSVKAGPFSDSDEVDAVDGATCCRGVLLATAVVLAGRAAGVSNTFASAGKKNELIVSQMPRKKCTSTSIALFYQESRLLRYTAPIAP